MSLWCVCVLQNILLQEISHQTATVEEGDYKINI